MRELEDVLDSKPNQQLIKGSKLQLNDTARILNPSKGQDNEGGIVGVKRTI